MRLLSSVEYDQFHLNIHMKLEHMQSGTRRIQFVRIKGELKTQSVPITRPAEPINHPMFPIERPRNEHTRASREDS